MSRSGNLARSRVAPFAQRARAAIEKHVGEARMPTAEWTAGINQTWVRWRREDGSWFYLGLHRHLDWVSGEAGLAREAVPLETLPLLAAGDALPAGAIGYRMRLGPLLDDEDRWWPAGSTPAEERERLEWIALQLRISAEPHFRRRPLPDRRDTGSGAPAAGP